MPEAYDIKSFCKAYSISRSSAYVEISEGRLKIVKVGRRTLIRREAAKSWLDSYEAKPYSSGYPACVHS
jgi:excisionase family DNA binding protein